MSKHNISDKQRKLAKLHGTPEEFENAVWRAYCDLYITMDEALNGIKKYKNEWRAAGKIKTN